MAASTNSGPLLRPEVLHSLSPFPLSRARERGTEGERKEQHRRRQWVGAAYNLLRMARLLPAAW